MLLVLVLFMLDATQQILNSLYHILVFFYHISQYQIIKHPCGNPWHPTSCKTNIGVAEYIMNRVVAKYEWPWPAMNLPYLGLCLLEKEAFSWSSLSSLIWCECECHTIYGQFIKCKRWKVKKGEMKCVWIVKVNMKLSPCSNKFLGLDGGGCLNMNKAGSVHVAWKRRSIIFHSVSGEGWCGHLLRATTTHGHLRPQSTHLTLPAFSVSVSVSVFHTKKKRNLLLPFVLMIESVGFFL